MLESFLKERKLLLKSRVSMVAVYGKEKQIVVLKKDAPLKTKR